MANMSINLRNEADKKLAKEFTDLCKKIETDSAKEIRKFMKEFIDKNKKKSTGDVDKWEKLLTMQCL